MFMAGSSGGLHAVSSEQASIKRAMYDKERLRKCQNGSNACRCVECLMNFRGGGVFAAALLER
jgi:hypothetical protein